MPHQRNLPSYQLGPVIKAARQALHLSQTDLAEILQISRSAVAQWERCLANPETACLPHLAKALHVTIDSLFPKEPEQMPFTIRHLSVLAYANGFTLWHYKSSKDKLATVLGDNYFREAEDMVTIGDIVMITAENGSALRVFSQCSAETVTLTALA